MNPLLTYLISGESFYPGLILLAAGFASMSFQKWRRWSDAAVVAGLLILALSSVSLPYFISEALLFAALIAWVLLRRKTKYGWILLIFPLILLGAELPWRLRSKPIQVPGRLWVIGDSISAGIGFAGEKTWSDLGTGEFPGWIVNRSVGGGTAQSALASLAKCDPGPGDGILIEIGGNDLLGGISAAEFNRRLNVLLARAAAYRVPVVMFELPLPPLRNGYSESQRRLAAKYGVTLIPRRDFAAIFRGKESTADGLHLSNRGHLKMYDIIRRVVYR